MYGIFSGGQGFSRCEGEILLGAFLTGILQSSFMWAIQHVLGDEKLQKQMIEEGHKQADKFNWDNEAKKLIDVFEEVARG